MNCKQATQLLSRQLDERLEFMDTARLRFHLGICSGCSAYSHNMSVIRKASQQFAQHELNNTPPPSDPT
jgi:predicted anti-sigma-YlaC factor YlaD